jgi:hypothetical protein
MANIPMLYKYLKQKKVGGGPDLIFGFSGVNDTAETDFGDFRSDYPGEYDDICKTGLACYSGTYKVLIDEKNRGSKSVQLSLKKVAAFLGTIKKN